MDEELKEELEENKAIVKMDVSKVGQDQIHDLLFSDKLSWQAIIYDLINTEQLDPWGIDLIVLTNKYLEKIRALEEANFFISSKVLFAAALLLRIKSDILLDQDLKSLDDILFGRKEEKQYHGLERIELDEDIPGLVARTPLPRFRKVTLAELMASLGKAIDTENRRIRKVVVQKQYEQEAKAVMPKHNINLKDKIADIYQKLLVLFEKREDKLAFSEISGDTKEERVYAFVSLLHLDNQQKVWLEQEKHFDEIWILLKHLYDKKYAQELNNMKKSVEEEFEKMANEDKKREEKHRIRMEKKEKEFQERSERAKKAWEKRKTAGENVGEFKPEEGDEDDEPGDEGEEPDDGFEEAKEDNSKIENFEELENKAGSNIIDKFSEEIKEKPTETEE